MKGIDAEERVRKEAIYRHLMGESPSSICRQLRKSRKWFYKWFKRYRGGNPDWFKDQPKIAHHIGNRTDEGTQNLIVEARNKLASSAPR